MRKKELLARRDALNSESRDLLKAEGPFNTSRAQEIETELAQIDAELSAIEKAEARLAAQPQHQPAQVRENLLDKPWGSLGEFLGAVRDAGTPNGRMDVRLASGASEGIAADGGFLVGTDQASGLLQRAYDSSVFANACTPINISSGADGVVINGIDETSRVTGSRWGGIRAYWATEAGTVTASQPKFHRIELKLNKLMALCYATDEVLQDAAVLESVISAQFPAEMAFVIDDCILRGTGAGQPMGILGHSALVTQAAEGGQTADTVNLANITKMYARLWPRSINNARWYINQAVLPHIMALTSAATSAATPMFIPPGQVTDAPRGLLLGRPIVVVEQCSAIGDVGDIIFADMSQYLLARKGAINSAMSMHVRFIYGEQTFRWTLRIDGQPAWKSALTPYKGSDSLSPFVTLAAR